jgi:hypothetical protein
MTRQCAATFAALTPDRAWVLASVLIQLRSQVVEPPLIEDGRHLRRVGSGYPFRAGLFTTTR